MGWDALEQGAVVLAMLITGTAVLRLIFWAADRIWPWEPDREDEAWMKSKE